MTTDEIWVRFLIYNDCGTKKFLNVFFPVLSTTLISLLILSFIQFRWAVSEEESKMYKPIRGHLDFSNWPKNNNLVEDVKDLTYCQVSLNSAQRFKSSERILANKRQGRQSLFSVDPPPPQKKMLTWCLASCQVSLNSVHRLQGTSRKCLGK